MAHTMKRKILRATHMLWSTSRSAKGRCGAGRIATLIFAPQRKPTTAEMKSAMQAIQRRRALLNEFIRAMRTFCGLCRSTNYTVIPSALLARGIYFCARAGARNEVRKVTLALVAKKFLDL